MTKISCDVIIVGAGPAGLAAGLSLTGAKAAILEKGPTAGRKLLLSGAGQCNYTNDCSRDEFLTKYGKNGRFLKPAIYGFDGVAAQEYFDSQGVKSLIREDGKVFPASLRAADILQAMLRGCSDRGTDLVLNATVREINKHAGYFTIKTESAAYESRYVILAAGGMSYAATGSDGDGFMLAEKLGHSLAAVAPALAPVYVRDYPFRDLTGVSFSGIEATLWRENKKQMTFASDLLLTHHSLSGPLILNNSRYMEPGDELRINFSGLREEEFNRQLTGVLGEGGRQQVDKVLCRLGLPRRFASKVLAMSLIAPKTSVSNITREQRKKIIETVTCCPLTIERLGGYNSAMVTRGGVSLKEINSKTMESKIVENLFFAGEVMDVDGDTGGYNIQAAMSTGWLAAQAISSRLRKE